MKNKIQCKQCDGYYTAEELNINLEYPQLIKCPGCGNKEFEEAKSVKALWSKEFSGVCYGHKTDQSN